MKTKQGFTLVELLAVIAILAILVIIALPNVMGMFNKSKENTFITELKSIYRTAESQWISESMLDTQEKVYSRCKSGCTNPLNLSGREELEYYIKLSKSGKVVEFYATDGTYQFEHNGDLLLTNIQGVEKIADLPETEIISISNIFSNGGGSNTTSVVVYPEGKDKSSVSVGDLVKIGDEEFYVVKNSGNDLVLITHYNLNVGNNKKASATEGIQDSDIYSYKSGKTTYGNVIFSSSNYWKNKIGDGLDYSGSYTSPNYPYVYDSNSNLYQYVENYKSYLSSLGVTIKEARLINYKELFDLNCKIYQDGGCNSAPSFIKETTYWIGNAYANYNILFIRAGNSIDNYVNDNPYPGVRPVIVI